MGNNEKELLQEKLNSLDSKIITETLLDITFNHPDYVWVQSQCINLIEKSNNIDVKGLAITCLGHIARIYKTLHNKNEAIHILEHLVNDADLGGRASDTLDDISQFT